MSLTAFALVLFGVLLNAGAQLLLKAGTNSIGAFEFSRGNIVPIGLRVATEPHILGGLGAYVISVSTWIGSWLACRYGRRLRSVRPTAPKSLYRWKIL